MKNFWSNISKGLISILITICLTLSAWSLSQTFINVKDIAVLNKELENNKDNINALNIQINDLRNINIQILQSLVRIETNQQNMEKQILEVKTDLKDRK